MFIVEVYVTNASLNVNQEYSYYSDFFIESFKRVTIEFAHSITCAIVSNCYEVESLDDKENELGFKLNKIIEVIDNEPIITLNQFELAKWLSYATVSPFIACLNTMLPKALRTTKRIEYQRFIECVRKLKTDYRFTKKQKEIYDSIIDGMSLKDARKISASIINKLINVNALEIYKIEKSYINNKPINNSSFKTLTNNQKNVFDSVLKTNKLVSLLYGITGSGKTEVYLHLAREYLNKGYEVLILVPEIALTPQMIQRVKERFNDVIFYHSELTDQERYEQYKRIKNNETKIVVGTRSSIFLPFNNLGLVIVDEEHDTSYKQDNTPCYNAISVAKKIANDFNGKVLLASATPSLDSYTRALKGEYQFLKLEERINNMLPSIEIVDLVTEVKTKNSYIISKCLKESIQETLNNHKQAIILLNRRGYSTVVRCKDCGETLMCESCDIPLTYHKDENILKCHQCGRAYSLNRKCKKCGSTSFMFYGFGTKKVEEELNNLFPNSRIERMDRDKVSKKGSYNQILSRVANREIDILIGTQMIAKGLDYPDVTLVGILNGDAGLMHQDFNSSKLTFDLLMQASGRSGRANSKGKCIIQAFNPDHFVLKAVLSQSYEYFYNIEMNYRNKLNYPPYTHIIEILVSDINKERLNKSAEYVYNKLVQSDMKIYKPVDITKINKLYRKRILILNKDIKPMLDLTWKLLNNYLKEKGLSKIKLDVDPLYLN